MPDILGESLRQLKKGKVWRTRITAIVLALSLLVSLDVFWVLRQPGLTLAGNADCGFVEHRHDENCDTPCPLPEHVHTLTCYANKTADVETSLDWQAILENYPFTGDLQKDLIGIAKTQVGYAESKENFQVDANGIRHGYTRYGAWYGVPYNDWSALFVSFCLHYAGADPSEYPSNIGANAMAESWKKLDRYAPAGTYDPAPGDLVFFTDATVGIISERISSSLYIIRGDVEDAVCANIFRVTDSSIAGWGIVGDLSKTDVPTPDLSEGPIFNIYAADDAPEPQATYSLRRASPIAEEEKEPTNILEYLEGKGLFLITLMDLNHHELPKDADGNYIAEPNTQYKLYISFKCEDGFPSGSYEYQFPGDAEVVGGNGTFMLNDTPVGTWSVSDTGLVSIIFNDKMESHTEVTITAEMKVQFPEQEQPIDFDGKIMVTIQKPQEEIFTTKLTKWGSQGILQTEKDNTNKIYWTIRIDGHQDSNIPGSIITDQIQNTNPNITHRYTESDWEKGIMFGASFKDENGVDSAWHKWTVSAEQASWDADGWTYYVEYTSTPNHTDIAGDLQYFNQVDVDNQTTTGTAYFSQSEIVAAVFKTGTLISDASGIKYIWEIQATIPGRKDPKKVDLRWYLNDEISIGYIDDYGVYYRNTWVENNLLNATITANYYGTTINVPNINDATEKDPYAWAVAWQQSGDGVVYGDNIYLLCRCKGQDEVLADGVPHWPYSYWENGVEIATDYCTYWTEVEDTTFTITYITDDFEAIEAYAGNGNILRNVARLSNDAHFGIDQNGANAPIPTMVEKEHKIYNDDTEFPHYTITVNEAKLTLTDGSPLQIQDVMTHSLAYIKGSMIIMAEDADGNTWELYRDKDFTIEYRSNGPPFGEYEHTHVIDIEILNPQPVKYILDYDTEVIYDNLEAGQKNVQYTNMVTVYLFGKPHIADTDIITFADINISARSYQIDLYKTASDSSLPLGGAKFGLFNEHGVLIVDHTTDEFGHLTFQTRVTAGIILREHQLYYIQELEAPPGYQLDKTQHWVCFCNEAGDSCSVYKEILPGVNVIRIPYGESGHFELKNELQRYYLPATGGPGIYPLILVSAMFIITPLVYISIRGRKRERRGVG